MIEDGPGWLEPCLVLCDTPKYYVCLWFGGVLREVNAVEMYNSYICGYIHQILSAGWGFPVYAQAQAQAQ
jgi:hypothetical protein